MKGWIWAISRYMEGEETSESDPCQRKIQIILEFSLMWIWLTCLLAFHMPWDRSDSTFHYLIDELYKEPFGYIEGIGGIESKRTIIHCCHNLCLSLHPLCPLEHFCVLPNIIFCLWACYREMEDWSGGGPSGGLGFSDSQTCQQRLYSL